MTRPIKVLLVAMAAVFCLGLVTAAVGIYFAVNFYRGTSEFRDGYAAMMRGDHSTAISKFTEAMGKPLAKDYRTYALEDRAFSEAAQNKRDDAIRDYTEALRSQPKLSFAYSARGELYDVKGEKDKAVSDYSEAIKLDPNDNRALYRRGLVCLERKEWDRAISDLSEAIRTGPAAAAYFARGQAYSRKNELDRGLADFDAAIDLWPHYADALVERGYLYKRRHNLEHAVADFTEADRFDPKNNAAIRARAFVGSETKRWPDAVADFTKAVTINPKDVIAFEGRGYAHMQMGDQEKAIDDFTGMIQLKAYARGYRLRAAVYARTGNYGEALSDLGKAKAASPKEASVLNDLAWLLATSPDAAIRNGAEAAQEAATACELSHWQNWQYIDTLAAAWAETGKFDLALSYEREAEACENVPQPKLIEMEKRCAQYERREPFRLTAQPKLRAKQ